MKNFILLVILGLGVSGSLSASHIVGGEFELQHLTGSRYTLSLNMYVDNLTSQPNLVFPTVSVSIFEKATDKLIRTFTISRSTQSSVPYTSVACAIGSLSTNKVLYTDEITLEPSVFNHPQGYYLSQERCCRNGTISNIQDPGVAGQTFYMEFPPVSVKGQPFLNSSPKLFPPVSDYACINSPFYFDFGGTDPDGDSLVYSMVSPLQGHSSTTSVSPIGLPAPYQPVKWLPGYSEEVQVSGAPPMSIDRNTGFLRVQASRLGLFVFGVKCEEYRNGNKIGEIRRDYQLLVISCPSNDKPRVNVKSETTAGFYAENQVIRIKAADDRCLTVYLSDTAPNEKLTVSAHPLNFSQAPPLLSISSGEVNVGGGIDSVKTSICFPSCFDTKGQVYQMNLIVADNGCSVPKKDTLRVSFVIDPLPDRPPAITTTAASVITTSLGQEIRFEVTGTDPDNDQVKVTAKGQNFDLSSQNISFPEVTGRGTATGVFSWPVDCGAMAQDSWKIDFTVTSMACGEQQEETITVEVRPEYQNEPPVLRLEPGDLTYDLPLFSPVALDVLGSDVDLNQLVLQAEGVGFQMLSYGMEFYPANGMGQVKATFKWTPACNALDRTEFQVKFTLEEQTCKPQPQVLYVTFRVPAPTVSPFVPANIFTPNGDQLNDYFEMPDLPTDDCSASFSQIQVFNRWGTKIYESRSRDFKWSGDNHSEGVYYYLIDFTTRQYKGTVTLVR
jgi:gliding motility-associated-like protein